MIKFSNEKKAERTTMGLLLCRLTNISSSFGSLSTVVPADEYLSAFVLNFNFSFSIRLRLRAESSMKTGTAASPVRWWQASYRPNRGDVFLEVCKLNLSVFFSELIHKFYSSRVYAAFVIASFFRWTHDSFLMQTTFTNAVVDFF